MTFYSNEEIHIEKIVKDDLGNTDYADRNVM